MANDLLTNINAVTLSFICTNRISLLTYVAVSCISGHRTFDWPYIYPHRFI